MQAEPKPVGTRVWWGGAEVRFIRWTDKALVFNWGNPRGTAMHVPRGTLARLQEKGVLRVEGYVPVWLEQGPPRDWPDPVTIPHLERHLRPARPARSFWQRLLHRRRNGLE